MAEPLVEHDRLARALLWADGQLTVFTLEQVRSTFTAWAPRYDLTHGSRLLKRREARIALAPRAGDRVLEVACGTGLNFPQLREMIGDEGSLVGVDVTPAMLDIARVRIARHGWRNVEVREADAAALPFPDASFDRALCAFALNIVPDYEGALAEVRRVLKPGGRFVALELRPMVASESRTAQWLLHRLLGICAVDASHRSLDAIQRTFVEVHVRRYLGGLLYIAVATKGGR